VALAHRLEARLGHPVRKGSCSFGPFSTNYFALPCVHLHVASDLDCRSGIQAGLCRKLAQGQQVVQLQSASKRKLPLSSPKSQTQGAYVAEERRVTADVPLTDSLKGSPAAVGRTIAPSRKRLERLNSIGCPGQKDAREVSASRPRNEA